ncbi:MAG: TetR/AcrR family transcriptional regulator [Verrucomicrobium sp.]|nr:TetR/AcrR family transcriptional regulator [Verrucomicrobium sp.]
MRKSRSSREVTRARIVETANALFRRFGYTKTSMAEIAAELKMSPANIYKFFPSKRALIEEGAECNMVEIQEELERIRDGKGEAIGKLEKIVRYLYGYHRKIFSKEKQIYQLVVDAYEEDWECIRDFREFFLEVVASIVREGVAGGEFSRAEASTAETLLDSLQWVVHPLLFPELDHKKVEGRVRAHIRFIEGALK